MTVRIGARAVPSGQGPYQKMGLVPETGSRRTALGNRAAVLGISVIHLEMGIRIPLPARCRPSSHRHVNGFGNLLQIPLRMMDIDTRQSFRKLLPSIPAAVVDTPGTRYVACQFQQQAVGFAHRSGPGPEISPYQGLAFQRLGILASRGLVIENELPLAEIDVFRLLARKAMVGRSDIGRHVLSRVVHDRTSTQRPGIAHQHQHLADRFLVHLPIRPFLAIDIDHAPARHGLASCGLHTRKIAHIHLVETVAYAVDAETGPRQGFRQGKPGFHNQLETNLIPGQHLGRKTPLPRIAGPGVSAQNPAPIPVVDEKRNAFGQDECMIGSQKSQSTGNFQMQAPDMGAIGKRIPSACVLQSIIDGYLLGHLGRHSQAFRLSLLLQKLFHVQSMLHDLTGGFFKDFPCQAWKEGGVPPKPIWAFTPSKKAGNLPLPKTTLPFPYHSGLI